MNQIVWSDLAYITFNEIADYLTENVSLDAAIKFNEQVESLLGKLETFSHLCQPHPRWQALRKCTINKYSSLSYRVESNKIHLVSFYDNRGLHPYWLRCDARSLIQIWRAAMMASGGGWRGNNFAESTRTAEKSSLSNMDFSEDSSYLPKKVGLFM